MDEKLKLREVICARLLLLVIRLIGGNGLSEDVKKELNSIDMRIYFSS